ncbi:hypothetical protein H0H92_010826, partial [Tricholoma furcatifolium]
MPPGLDIASIIFSGEPQKEGSASMQPDDFLKAVRTAFRCLGITTDADKLEAFPDFLKGRSVAERWFKDPEQRWTTWQGVQTAFMARFPGVEKVEKSPIDLERELQEKKLRVEDLGTTRTYGGVEAWSHIAFADEILDLATRAGIAGGTSSIFVVRDNLPDILKTKVSETQTSWMTFCNAIKAVDMSHIRDGKRKHEREVAEKASTAARIRSLEDQLTRQLRQPPDSPTKAIREQLSRTSVSATPSAAATSSTSTNSNPFLTSTGGRGNLNFVPNRRPPTKFPAPTDAIRVAVQARLADYPIQLRDDAGIAAYKDQLRAWKERHPDAPDPDHTTGFPLAPGTLPPLSGECFKCGLGDHKRADCTALSRNYKES